MAWKLKGGKEQLCNIEDAPGSIRLRLEKYKGMQIELKRNKARDAERQLGVRLSMCGGDTDEYVYRLEQSKLLSGKIKAEPFTQQDAEVIYMERWIASIGYCLPVTQFSAA